MKYYKYIIIALTYINNKDLDDFCLSVSENISDFRIVIVNSFHDNQSSNMIKEEAIRLNCDFIEVENKGYGSGNNLGIDYAIKNYKFDYLIISNPDVIIKRFSMIDSKVNAIYGGLIKTISGKNQNPYWYVENPSCEFLIYYGLKKNVAIFSYIGFLINKIIREISLKYFKISNKKYMKVFALHGAFIIFHYSILKKLNNKIFDNNMFLFAEEAFLAHTAKQKGIEMLLVKDIEIYHKEDGSVSLSSINENNEIKKSVVYYYEKLILKK